MISSPLPGSVAIVIPAYNDEANLPAVLEAACALACPALEIVVVDDASGDRTSEVAGEFARRFRNVRVLRNERNLGLCRTMRRGAEATRSEFLCILQSDCRVEGADWLERMLAPMADARVAVVMSQRRVPDRGALGLGGRLFDAVAPQGLENREGRPAEAKHTSGKADVCRRAALEAVGYWDCSAFRNSGEDRDLSERLRKAGWNIVLSDGAWVTNLFSGRQRSVAGALRKALLYGASAKALFDRHRYDGLRSRVFLATWAAAATFALLLFSGRPWGGAAGGVLFAPFAAFLARYAWKSCRHSLRAGDGWAFQPAVFGFAVTWRLLTGIGYARAWLGLDEAGPDRRAHGARMDAKLENVRAFLDDVRGLTVVDIGMGGGGLLAELDAANRCVGLDLVEEHCRTALANGVRRAVAGDACAMPFRDGSVDCVVASEVLEHVPDLGACLGEVRRVLKADGRLVVVLPNDRHWFLYRMVQLDPGAALRDRGHVRTFASMRQIRSLFASRKFAVGRERPIRYPLRLRTVPLPVSITLHYVLELRPAA